MKTALWSIEGNGQKLDGGAMFGNVPRPVWQKWEPPDSLGRIQLATRALLVQLGEKYVLCETGIGAFFEPKMSERFGVENPNRHVLRDSLRAVGIDESKIDFVVLSHLHFDHAGGLLPTYEEIQSGREDLLFSNARYVVGREAWQRALKPHSRDRASFIPGLSEKLEKSRRLLIVDGPSHPEVLPQQISFFISNGHTPGQMLTQIKGQNGSVTFAGDLVPGTAWVHLPITMGYDRFPELLIDEKAQLYDRLGSRQGWLFFTHDTKVTMAKVQKLDDGRFAPIDPQAQLRGFEI